VKRCVACDARFESQDWTCPACGFAPPLVDGILRFAPDVAASGVGFDPRSFEQLSELESASFWFQARSRLIGWALDTYFPHAQSLLEVGCGTGYVLQGVREARPQMELAGADLYVEGLRYAQARVPDTAFYQLDATRIPFSEAWDVVGAFDVLEHVEDDAAFLSGMYEAATPGGGIVVTVPQHPTLWSAADEYARHARRYRRRELTERVAHAGFRVTRVTSFVSLLLPAMYLSRLRSRHAVGYDPVQEHRSAQRLPWLGRVLDAERWTIGRGANLPAGGSLLLIAHRP